MQTTQTHTDADLLPTDRHKHIVDKPQPSTDKDTDTTETFRHRDNTDTHRHGHTSLIKDRGSAAHAMEGW